MKNRCFTDFGAFKGMLISTTTKNNTNIVTVLDRQKYTQRNRGIGRYIWFVYSENPPPAQTGLLVPFPHPPALVLSLTHIHTHSEAWRGTEDKADTLLPSSVSTEQTEPACKVHTDSCSAPTPVSPALPASNTNAVF